ncbi:YcjX family protein [Limibaculum sp. FT325]|uniref:YcjX family protein n=1 Tax=Thermohalobaculum sediminis TaxID=2939436 RepID=UPI0020BFC07F|nr:YcjX family protein [Limibaculum sediminis]MCL5776353.1 YcjX family protein [Limibaculum sediminis]
MAIGNLGLGGLADDLLGGLDRLREQAGSAFDPTLRLGVTGLAGAGKTVFITALVASLISRDRMRLLGAEAEGRIEAVMLRPQPDPDLPRFAFEAHMAVLGATPPHWPESTRSVSQIRVAIRHRPRGILAGLAGPVTLNLDIVDYPGEWLLDLPLIEQDYDEWATGALAAAASPARRDHAAGWRGALAATDPAGPHDEAAAERLAEAYRGYLAACRAAGLSALAPGRFLMPGELAGSPALTFAPLPRPEGGAPRGSLYAEMRARFDAYRRVVAKPFFRNHFARLDRQVVLIDALGALADGPRALADLTASMGETLAAFRHGRPGWLDRITGARRIDRILFAASKADHLHHAQHARLARLVETMLAEAARRAAFRGARTRGMAIAAIRATAEQEVTEKGRSVGLVRGVRARDGREVAIYPGALPEEPGALMAAAEAARPGDAPADWPDMRYATLDFAPPRWPEGSGPPHLRLDQALDFLIGDRLE